MLDHHFLVAQHFVDVQRHALRRAAHHHHGLRAPGGRSACTVLQQAAQPVERQHLLTHGVPATAVGLFDLVGRHAAHDLDQRRGHGHPQVTAAQHHHLRDGGRQRQHQLEGRTLAGRAGRLDAATHRVDLGAHHVQPHPAAGQFVDLGGGTEARPEDQVGQVGIARLLVGGQQPPLLGPLADAGQVQAGAVVAAVDADLVAFLRDGDADLAGGLLAGCQTQRRRLDTVGHAVAQQVFEGADHALQHTAVDFDRPADDVQPHLLATVLGSLAHHAVEAVGQALEFDHARAQQVFLQLTRQPGLGCQFVFGRLQRALHAALHGGHVVDRLGHHARQLLEAREAVHLQWIEGDRRRLGGFDARGDLRFGLQLDVAQLAAQTVEVVGQVVHRALQLAHVGVDAGPGDAHFTGMVDQPVQQARAHAHRGGAAGAALDHGGLQQAPVVEVRPVDRTLRSRLDGVCVGNSAGGGSAVVGRGSLVGPPVGRQFDRHRLRHRRRGGLGDSGARRGRLAQQVVGRHHGIGASQQGLDLRGVSTGRGGQVFDRGFQPVGHFTQAHRAGQPGPALERVQRAHAGRGGVVVRRVQRPVAQARLQLRQQLFGLFLEDREQLAVDHVDGFDVVIVVEGTVARGACRHRCSGDLGQRFERGKAGGCRRHHRSQRGRAVDRGFFRQAEVEWHRLGNGCRFEHVFQAACGLCRRVGTFGRALGQLFLVLEQPLQQAGCHRLEETGSELVQQAPDLVGRFVVERRLAGAAVVQRRRADQHMFERPRQAGQLGITHGGRTAGQRMGQHDRAFRHRPPLVLDGPLGQLGAQPARQLVGFVEVDVEQRDRNAQRADHPHLFIGVGVGVGVGVGISLGLGLGRSQRCGVDLDGRRFGLGQRLDARRPGQALQVELQAVAEGQIDVRQGQGIRRPGVLGRRRCERYRDLAKAQIVGQVDVGRQRRGRRLVHWLQRRGRAEVGVQVLEIAEVDLDHVGQRRQLGHRDRRHHRCLVQAVDADVGCVAQVEVECRFGDRGGRW